MCYYASASLVFLCIIKEKQMSKYNSKFFNKTSKPEVQETSNVLEAYHNSLYSYQPTIVNHRYKVPGYPNIIIGGSIIDAADWEHLHKDFEVTDVINVETEHDDTSKVPAEHLLQVQTEDNGAPFPPEKILAAIEFAKGSGKVIYVHCQMGGSRSPAWAYALLRGTFKASKEEAMAAIVSARRGVDKLDPSRGFIEDYGHHPVHVSYLASVEAAIKILEPDVKLPRLNIASGPNIFPFDGWINYDREDSQAYLDYLRTLKDPAVVWPPIEIMPEHQQQVVKYIRNNGNIDFRVRDLRDGFPQHPDCSVESIYLGQMIEHINPLYEVPPFLKECYRMLKPNGVIRITTPDLDILIDAYKNGQMNKFESEQPEFYKGVDPSAQLSYLMFGAAGPSCTWDNYEGHMFLYTQRSITAVLHEAGFKDMQFYYEPGKSKDPVMAVQVVDAGLTHSFIVEAVK